MLLSATFELPLHHPVPIFGLVLLILLLAPMAFSKLKIPGIIGLIISGLLIGPHGFNILERGESVELFSTIGILYIMFLAGLELEMNEFLKNRVRSLVFGGLSFLIPFGSGILIGHGLLGFSLEAGFITGLMLASHTLVAYPIASRLGIQKNRVVMITVGGTILADSLVLVFLAVVEGFLSGEMSAIFWLRLIGSIAGFIAFVFLTYPHIGRWFFKNVENDQNTQFVFVLTMVFLAAFLAEVAGMEAIIGAFMSGLALNRLIPAQSALMSRLEFVGNSIFIPFFLISVGMMVDLRIFTENWTLVLIVGILTLAAVATKWLAAWITQLSFHFNSVQRNVMFGLSTARAAATIAVVLVGFEAGAVDAELVNATVAVILLTSLVGSVVTENAGRKLAAMEKRYEPEHPLDEDRILIPVANPATAEYLLDFAVAIRQPGSSYPIMALSVVKDDDTARKESRSQRHLLDEAMTHLRAMDVPAQALTRIDMNVSSGIVRAMKERAANELIIGWNERMSTRDFFFGSTLHQVLHQSFQMVYVLRQIQPLNTNEDLFIIMNENARFEYGFVLWVDKMAAIARHLTATLHFIGDREGLEAVSNRLEAVRNPAPVHFYGSTLDKATETVHRHADTNDLIILISAREGTLSYDDALDAYPKKLQQEFPDNNLLTIFPQQQHDQSRSDHGYPITSPPHFPKVNGLNKIWERITKNT